MTERELGELSARLTIVERDLKQLAADVREIRDALLTVRGGKKALVLVVAAASSAGAMAANWLPTLFK